MCLDNYDFYSYYIDNFCNLYNINYKELYNILNNELKIFKYKFSRIICNFCIENGISMEDRKRFYF